ncbi:MAG: hypothetical protein QXW32_06440 [Nitrososphaerales archaeon]
MSKKVSQRKPVAVPIPIDLYEKIDVVAAQFGVDVNKVADTIIRCVLKEPRLQEMLEDLGGSLDG